MWVGEKHESEEWLSSRPCVSHLNDVRYARIFLDECDSPAKARFVFASLFNTITLEFLSQV